MPNSLVVNHRSDPNASADRAFGAVAGAGAFGSFVVTSIFSFFGDLWETLRSKGGIDEMQRKDAALARSELLMLAILAGRRTTEQEMLELHAHFAAEDVPEDAVKELNAFSARVEGIQSDPEKLSSVVAAVASRIPSEDRRDALAAVVRVAREMQTSPGPRELAHAHVDVPTMVRRFAEAMGVTEVDRDAAIAAVTP